MISRFIAIRNIGKFVNCNAASDVTFRKLTLIFGENGKGKTTMGDILRSLSTGNPEFINGRATLGSQIPPFAQLLVNGNTVVNFKDGRWDGPGPRLAIYDSTFIDENVHSGNNIDREHRKNLYGVIVGEEGVALAKKVDDFDSRIREINKDITAKENVVKAYLPQGMPVKTFLGLSEIPGLDGAIAEKQAEVAMLERAKEIKDKPVLAMVALPQLSPNFDFLLAKLLEDVSKDAESRVKQHLGKHSKSGGEQWVAQGLKFAPDAQCPFCGQSLEGVDLIAAYKAYFSESYEAFKKELSALRDSVQMAFADTVLLSTQRAIAGNGGLSAFWGDFVTVDLPEVPFGEIETALIELRDAAMRRLSAKLASPLEIVPADPDFDRFTESHRAVTAMVTGYNSAVVAVNERIAAKKRELDAGNLAKAKIEFASLLAVQKRFEAAVDEACRHYSETVTSKATLEIEKAAARGKLDEYCKSVFIQYEKRINALLDIFGAGFRIGETKTSLAGGTVSSSFQIIINKVAVDLAARG
jgi:wobble nucleotide-excising tRNase